MTKSRILLDDTVLKSWFNPKEHSWGLLGPGRGISSNRDANTKGWLTKLHIFLKNSFPKSCRLYLVKYFSKNFLHENLWKTNVKAQGPVHTCTRHDYNTVPTVYPKKYAHGFCFAVLCCGYTWTDFPISIRLTSLALWQSNDCPSASKATLMNMDKYFMWIHYERLHNHNKAKHNKTRVHISWDILYINNNRKYSSGDRTMFDSILTVFVVIYVIVQWTHCSKCTTSMNDLTTLEYWWIGVSRQILFDEYYDIRWYEMSWTILSYGPVLS